MTSFYTTEELRELGLKDFGEHVLISRKASIYGAETISVGNHVRIDDFCILSGRIDVGNYVHIAAYTALYGGKDGVFIEDFANLSSRISVYSVSDDYSGETMTNPMVPDKYKNVESAPVWIEKHVIIGSTSVVMPGVRLAEGSAFGSFSFIKGDSEPWSINAGIPAKKIKDRKKEVSELENRLLSEKK
ncbi:MAG: acyltransferase [Clostridium sp.]|nr:acyltransferase [Clostridium sp.]